VRNKIIVGILVLSLAISLGFNLYLYSVMVNKQATINNMGGQIIYAWVGQMNLAAHYLENATTNIDVEWVRWLFLTASDVARSARISDGTLYSEMEITAAKVCAGLRTYGEGSPTFVRRINATAIAMFKNLAQKIQNTTELITGSEGPWLELKHLNGVDPVQLLKERGILDQIINGCIDIQDLSEEISDFNPKFQ
jgi:hypothetical protein